MKNVKESLAGRVGIINLLGFSMAEDMGIKKTKNSFFEGKTHIPKNHINIIDLFKTIQRGSFPALTHKNTPPIEIFYNSYLQTYIDRDLREIFHVSKINTFHKFLQLLAARTGQILNYSDLARDADISVHAVKEWINILASSSQIYLLEPYYKNISKRMIKSPKIYFLDTGLAAYLTKWKTYETLLNGAMAGSIFETFVISEIIKSYWHRGKSAPIYYYRDKEGHEVDLLLEINNILHPFEIKLSSTVHKTNLKNINYLKKNISNIGKGGIISVSSKNIPLDKTNDLISVSSVL